MNNKSDMNGTFTSRLAQSGTELVYFICGKHNGLWAWYYVRIDKRKHTIFKRTALTGSFDIADFGTVLASGYGDNPPAALHMQFENGSL